MLNSKEARQTMTSAALQLQPAHTAINCSKYLRCNVHTDMPNYVCHLVGCTAYRCFLKHPLPPEVLGPFLLVEERGDTVHFFLPTRCGL